MVLLVVLYVLSINTFTIPTWVWALAWIKFVCGFIVALLTVLDRNY